MLQVLTEVFHLPSCGFFEQPPAINGGQNLHTAFPSLICPFMSIGPRRLRSLRIILADSVHFDQPLWTPFTSNSPRGLHSPRSTLTPFTSNSPRGLHSLRSTLVESVHFE
jgi:hypothetical protein